jgi:YD repeat-containing protein
MNPTPLYHFREINTALTDVFVRTYRNTMRIALSPILVTLACLTINSSVAHSDCTSGYYYYQRYNVANSQPPGYPGWVCSSDGWWANGVYYDCNGSAHVEPNPVACSEMIDIDEYWCHCSDDSCTYYGPLYRNLCPCACGDAEGLSSDPQTGPAEPNNCGSSCNPELPVNGPELCDGLENDNEAPFDKGCGGDENACSTVDNDGDHAPVRYTSGRVESLPLSFYSVASPDVFFGYRVSWNSESMRTGATAQDIAGTQDTLPTIHSSNDATHYLGNGWLDNYSDELLINTPNKSSSDITWISQTGTVTFTGANNWKSWSGKYQLIDRGESPPDGFGRWVVTTTDTAAAPIAWAFDEVQYTASDGSGPYTVARLTRHASLTSNTANLVGRYGYTVAWGSNGTIENVVDTIGREFDFSYVSSPPESGITYRTALANVSYRPSSSASAVTVVSLEYNDWRLERFDYGSSSYRRFLYNDDNMFECPYCGALITDVIGPGDGASETPSQSAAKLASEVTLEHDDYGSAFGSGEVVAVHSTSVGREYAYEYGSDSTVRFDLKQVGTSCSSGCVAGYACREADSTCYVADIITHDATSILPLSHVSSGSTSGNPEAFTRTYDAQGNPLSQTTSTGVIDSIGFDSADRPRCIVRNASDTQAFSDPTHPDTSSCAGSANSQVVQVNYASLQVQKNIPSEIAAGQYVTTTWDLDSSTLLPTATTISGYTHDITGATIEQTQTISYTYDTLGRVLTRDGPLDDSVSFDASTTSYYATSPDGEPFDVGNVYQRSVYVGSAGSNYALTTTYSNYDEYNVAETITDANGNITTMTPSNGRLTWTIARQSGSGASSAVIMLNTNGTIRSLLDADGVCITLQYSDTAGYIGRPVVIKRGSNDASCGLVPIVQTTGEVEVRSYINEDPSRLSSITRFQDGSAAFSYSGITYDRDRKPTSEMTIDSAQAISLGYDDMLQNSIVIAGGVGSGGWQSDIAFDQFGRPTSVSRYVDASNVHAYTYSYASPFSMRPAQLTRGLNGTSSATTSFVYDDFGRLVETTVPEEGSGSATSPTRYEYDAADRKVKERHAAGTTSQRTAEMSYDSLGRLTYVDNDIEEPVDCSTAAAGTQIADSEFRYDTCDPSDTPTGFVCTNALGALTMARVVVRCGTSNEVIKHGRWYAYDNASHVASIAYATVDGDTISVPAVMQQSFSAAGRQAAYSSPLNSAYGTSYAFDAASGRVSQVFTPTGTAFVQSVTYRPFGPMTNMSSCDSCGSNVETTNTYRSDDSLAEHAVVSAGTSLSDQSFSYSASGMLTLRVDAADNTASRYYAYDGPTRLTCEARGDASVVPSAEDCVVSSSRADTLVGFGNGESAISPMDVRTTIFASTPDGTYAGSGSDSLAYVAGSSQTQSSTRSDSSTITFAYDGEGRRTADADSRNVGLSTRQFSYLPNGLLGSVTGTTPDGDAYSVTMTYDADGRPDTITDGDAYELFWDDDSRLIAVDITPGERGSGAPDEIRWHYHYLAGMLIAATRELVSEAETTVDEFSVEVDERGLVTKLFVPQESGGAEIYWEAQWNAAGWRTVTSSADEMWVPFGLPGQVVLGKTSVSGGTIWGTESSSGSLMRPPVALNSQRAYDPFLGAFLSPDPDDKHGRLMPEGYAYGRNNSLEYIDADGADSKPLSDSGIAPELQLGLPKIGYILDQSCASRRQDIQDAMDQAALAVATCNGPGCANLGNNRRLWVYAILTGTWACVGPGQDFSIKFETLPDGPEHFEWFPAQHGPDDVTPGAIGETWAQDPHRGITNGGTASTHFPLWGGNMGDRITVLSPELKPGDGCLATQIAHEALHAVRALLDPSDGGIRKDLLYWLNGDGDYTAEVNPLAENPQEEEDFVTQQSQLCVSATCKKPQL